MSRKGRKPPAESPCKTARALIHDLCSNFDSASRKCLVRNDYPECPQLIAQSVCCPFFRDVLLEDKKGKLLKEQIFQEDHVKRCEECGQLFRALTVTAKYCLRCSIELWGDR